MKRPNQSSESQTQPGITDPKDQMDADTMGWDDMPFQSAAWEEVEEVPQKQTQSQNSEDATVSSAKPMDAKAQPESLTDRDFTPDELDQAGEDVMMETQSSTESGKPALSSAGKKGSHKLGPKITDYFGKPLSGAPSTRYVHSKPQIQFH